MQPSDDPTLLRTLVERLVDAPLLVGALPPSLPLDLPLPPGTTVIGSVVHPGFMHPVQSDVELEPERITVYLDVPGTPVELHAYFTDVCRAQGWTVPDAGRHFPPSIAGQMALPSMVNAQGPDDRHLHAMIRTEGHGRCDVRLDFGAMPRAMRDRGHDMLTLVDRILMADFRGGNIVMHGGQGSDTSATAEATATGFASAADVEDRLSERCLAAGWTRSSGGGEGSFAWSRWSLPDGDDYHGLLVVAEGPSPGHVSITLRVERTAADDEERQGSTGFSFVRQSFMVAAASSSGLDVAADSPSGADEKPTRIACPRCGEVPSAAAVWGCYPGCHTSWNTFNTRGRCPGCGKRWTETMCLACGAVSPHDDWYQNGDDVEA